MNDTSAAFTPRLLTLLLASTMTVMAGATISPALPAIQAAFADVPDVDVWARLVLTLPALFTALGSPLAGYLTDRVGRRPVLLGAMVLYGIGGAGGGAVSSIWALLVTRALLGLSVGGLMTAATTLIADYFSGPRRSAVMGQQSAFMAGGGVLYILAGGALADWSWRAPFAVYLLAFALLVPALWYVNEPDEHANRGAGTLRDLPWATVGPIYALAFLGMASFYMIPVQIPFYLTRLGIDSGLLTGVAIAAATVMGAVMGAVYGRVQGRLGYRGTLAVLLVFFAAGYAVIGWAGSFTGVMVGIGIAGVGTGLMMPNFNNWLGALAPPSLRGKVVGGLTTCFFVGQFTSPLMTQPVIDATSVGTAFLAVAGLLGVLATGTGAHLVWRRAQSAPVDGSPEPDSAKTGATPP
jgi:MFS family permease